MSKLNNYSVEELQAEIDTRNKKKAPLLSCYDCSHIHVCKYWGRWSDLFPYKSDNHIKNYLTGLTETLATACAYHSPFKTE